MAKILLATGMLFIIMFTALIPSQARALDRWDIYVWDFVTRNQEDRDLTKDLRDLTKDLTVEFEEALEEAFSRSKKKIYVLKRPAADSLISLEDKEKTIVSLDRISQATLNKLKTFGVDVIIFGEVYENKISVLVVRISDNSKIDQRMVHLPQDVQNDYKARVGVIKALVDSLKIKPIPPSNIGISFLQAGGDVELRQVGAFGVYLRDTFSITGQVIWREIIRSLSRVDMNGSTQEKAEKIPSLNWVDVNSSIYLLLWERWYFSIYGGLGFKTLVFQREKVSNSLYRNTNFGLGFSPDVAIYIGDRSRTSFSIIPGYVRTFRGLKTGFLIIPLSVNFHLRKIPFGMTLGYRGEFWKEATIHGGYLNLFYLW